MDGATLVMVVGLLVLSLVSGMLGLGVAFAAVPFLALFMTSLVDQVPAPWREARDLRPGDPGTFARDRRPGSRSIVAVGTRW